MAFISVRSFRRVHSATNACNVTAQHSPTSSTTMAKKSTFAPFFCDIEQTHHDVIDVIATIPISSFVQPWQ
jgi:hypothetical protein